MLLWRACRGLQRFACGPWASSADNWGKLLLAGVLMLLMMLDHDCTAAVMVMCTVALPTAVNRIRVATLHVTIID